MRLPVQATSAFEEIESGYSRVTRSVSGSIDVEIADMNGDLALDLVIVEIASYGHTFVLLGSGSGTFTGIAGLGSPGSLTLNLTGTFTAAGLGTCGLTASVTFP